MSPSVTTVPVFSPSSVATRSAWAVRVALSKALANSGASTTFFTTDAVRDSTADPTPAARSWSRFLTRSGAAIESMAPLTSGAARSSITAVVIWSVISCSMRACTSGAEATGATRLTKASVSVTVRDVQVAMTATGTSRAARPAHDAADPAGREVCR